jgi:hypothetical protein
VLKHGFICTLFSILSQNEVGSGLLVAAYFWTVMRFVSFYNFKNIFCRKRCCSSQSDGISLNSTIHLSAIILPIAAYNGRIDRLQVWMHSTFDLLWCQEVYFCAQFVLNSFCSRLNGLSPPLVNFSGWTRPLGKNFLIALNAKVLFFYLVESSHVFLPFTKNYLPWTLK